MTEGQCPGSSVCPSEEIVCSCVAQGILIQWINNLFTDIVAFTNTGSTMVGAQVVESATGARAVATAVNPLMNITSDLTLSVTTTATLNASQFNNTAIRCEDASGPPGGMQQMIFLFGRFIHNH